MHNHHQKYFSNNNHKPSTQSCILDALPKAEFERIQPFLEPVILSHGKLIFQPDEPIPYVYFPSSGMISVTALTEDGKNIEIATVGREGMAGIDVVLGVDSAPHECMVQVPGEGFRIKTNAIRHEFKQGGKMQDLLLRYAHAYIVHISQAVVCNRLHTLDVKLATWLMITRDRVESDKLNLTQEFIATMLGVNRPIVSTIASKLQSEGFIKYRRGKITILNPKGLEGLACDCYQTIKKEYAQLPG